MNIMQRHIKCSHLLLKVVLLCWVVVTVALPAAANAASIEDRIIKIAGDREFPPFEYIGDTGDYKGFNVDIMRAISIEVGLDIELIPMSWNKAVLALGAGEVDAIQGMKYSENRANHFDFSDGYLTSSQAIFVRKSNHYIINLEDLRGNEVAVQKQDISYEMLKDKSNIKLILTENQAEGMRMLLNGEIDAFVGNRLTGFYHIQKWHRGDDVKVVGELINPTKYALAVKKENRQLIKEFNEGLQTIKKNGTYDKISEKWFGKTIQEGISLKTLRLIIIITASAVIFAIITIKWNKALKREVVKKTAQLNAANKDLYQTHLEIQESDKFKQQILDSVFSGIITLGKQKEILTINFRAEVILDLNPKFLGCYFDQTFLKKYFSSLQIDQILEGSCEKASGEITIGETNGHGVVDYTISPLMGQNNRVSGVVLNFADITEAKMMKEQLVRKDKMRALGLLIAGIAHELRNPLTSIKTFVELLPKKFDNPKFRDEIATLVPAEIARLNGLINDLLDYSKPRSPHPEVVNIKETLASVLVLFQKNFKQKGIICKTELAEGLTAFVDRQQFRQVLINVLMNSVESFADGGEIIISGGREEKTFLIIGDNGCGIGPEDLSLVFDPFYTNREKGTGLGLTISYQIIQENNGTMTIESEEGRWTRVRLELPSNRNGG